MLVNNTLNPPLENLSFSSQQKAERTPVQVASIGMSPKGDCFFGYPGFPEARELQPGEKLEYGNATLLNDCKIPISIVYFGLCEHDTQLGITPTFEIIYQVPNAPFPVILSYEVFPGDICLLYDDANPYFIGPNNDWSGTCYRRLTKISKEELRKIEANFQNPEKTIKGQSLKSFSSKV